MPFNIIRLESDNVLHQQRDDQNHDYSLAFLPSEDQKQAGIRRANDCICGVVKEIPGGHV
jgi:hypothetical protein